MIPLHEISGIGRFIVADVCFSVSSRSHEFLDSHLGFLLDYCKVVRVLLNQLKHLNFVKKIPYVFRFLKGEKSVIKILHTSFIPGYFHFSFYCKRDLLFYKEVLFVYRASVVFFFFFLCCVPTLLMVVFQLSWVSR